MTEIPNGIYATSASFGRFGLWVWCRCVLQVGAPFDLLALHVSHCMLPGESDPPQASGVQRSTSYPGYALEVFPVDGQGWFSLNDPFAAADLSILPWECRFGGPGLTAVMFAWKAVCDVW